MKERKKMEFHQKDILTIFMVILSALIYSFGIEVFAKSGNLFPGGFSGIARLLMLILDDYLNIQIPFGIIYFVLNLIVVLVVMKHIGPKFMIYSILWFTLASIFTSIIHLPTITEDLLLISVFGGLVNGVAVGLSLRYNASTGGTDFIAIDLSIRRNRPMWNYIFLLNVVVLCIAGFIYGWNVALYSIIFQFVSTEVVKTLHKRYKVSRFLVVTDHSEEISNTIFDRYRHGITKISCEGVYSKKNHDLLIMTVDANQVKEIEKCILSVDPKAFIMIDALNQVAGNFVQEPIE